MAQKPIVALTAFVVFLAVAIRADRVEFENGNRVESVVEHTGQSTATAMVAGRDKAVAAAQSPTASTKALRELRDVRSSLGERRITLQAYTQRVIFMKKAVDRFLATAGTEAVGSAAIRDAMRYYVVAASVWWLKENRSTSAARGPVFTSWLDADDQAVLASCAGVYASGQKNREVVLDANTAIKALWVCASKSISLAESAAIGDVAVESRPTPSPTEAAPENDPVVYALPTSYFYHRKDCQELKGQSPVEKRLSDVGPLGFPCQVCRPPANPGAGKKH